MIGKMKTPETDAIYERLLAENPGNLIYLEEMLELACRLERERASAIKKIQRQAERIRQLEGTTNHAGGTPLSIALRERDEVRQQYDDLATKHMLAVNKLAEERDQALMDRANGDMATMTRNHYERLIKERDEARADAAALADKLSGLELRSTEELARLEQERDEAREIAQQLIHIASHCLGWHENANPETITEAIKRWNAATKK